MTVSLVVVVELVQQESTYLDVFVPELFQGHAQSLACSRPVPFVCESSIFGIAAA